MNQRRSVARAVFVAISAALLFAAACGGGSSSDDNTGNGTPNSDDDGTLSAVAQTFVAGRSTPTGAVGTPERRGTATPRGDEPIDLVPVDVPPAARPAVDAVIAEVLRRLIEVHEEDITVIAVSAQDWSNSCLDVLYANQAETCQQVITPGYEVVVHYGDTVNTWHTDEDGSVVRFADQQILTNTN